MPAKYEGWTLRQIERDLGLGTPARKGRVFRAVQHDGDAFILGIADNLMAEGKLERVQRVTEMVQEFGQYPIRIG